MNIELYSVLNPNACDMNYAGISSCRDERPVDVSFSSTILLPYLLTLSKSE